MGSIPAGGARKALADASAFLFLRISPGLSAAPQKLQTALQNRAGVDQEDQRNAENLYHDPAGHRKEHGHRLPADNQRVGDQLALMKLLRQLSAEGRGITAVMHDLPLALNFADTVAVMAEGKIVMVGTPREIAASGVIGTVFGVEVMQTDGEYWCRMK